MVISPASTESTTRVFSSTDKREPAAEPARLIVIILPGVPKVAIVPGSLTY
jgi:hypothetical protein